MVRQYRPPRQLALDHENVGLAIDALRVPLVVLLYSQVALIGRASVKKRNPENAGLFSCLFFLPSYTTPGTEISILTPLKLKFD